ncbi:TetR/AcrR family transcriptional regulator [Kineosporia mesophila]|uniref:TetR/AcrR family transcriptional regulator n=1 Tax=Kineosporia mesophila TaxID=566012 RepID=A0ABP6Z4W7_9ACTN|nr:TetR/AcrR family transcriptional regulator [Kineosporia mesophila]MCD5352653.1 TetR/AcrR family transcriptional regulator [Kineosporia mesophila]
MPKIVDHEERRTEVLNATWRVIGRYGLEGATVRRIADEAGYSNGILQHYFQNKEDILISAHQLAFSRAGERIARVTADRTGLEALRRALFEALPLDAEGVLEAQVDVSFLGYTVGNARLREIRRVSNEGSRRQWAGFVEAAQAVGDIDADDDGALIVDDLMVLIDSLSVAAIIEPGRMTAERQMLLVDRYLLRIATGPEVLARLIPDRKPLRRQGSGHKALAGRSS